MTPHLSATVVLLRRQARGFSLFLVRRHGKSGFMPNAWVFPGGRVDPGDHLVGHPALRGGPEALDMDPEEGTAVLVAAVRETFEEAGIWLGDGTLPEALRGPLARNELALPDVLATHDATLHLDRLHPWSWWITPEAEPRRYDTRFLLAVVEGAQGRHDEHETVDSGWFTPAEILLEGRFPMAPPTWWTVKELGERRTVEEVLEAASERPQRPIQPILRTGAGGLELLLPGHPDHPAPPYPGLPPHVRFAQGRWWAD